MWEQIVAFLKAQGLTDVPVDLTDPRISADKLSEVIASVKGQYREARKGGTPKLAESRQLADAIRVVQAEIDARAEQARLDAAVDGPEPDPAPEGDEPNGDEPVDSNLVVVDLDPETPLLVADATTTDGSLTDDAQRSKELATAATAALANAGGQSDADRTGGTTDSVSRPPLVAAASVAGVEFGQPLNDLSTIGRVTEEVVASLRGGMSSFREGMPERKIQVASVLGYADRPGHDGSLVLSQDNSARTNTEIIRKALAAHTAAVKNGEPAAAVAATFCAPYDVIREIPDSTDTSQPLRDSLPFVPFGHGGFTFNAGVQFADVTGAVDTWTPTDQDNVDPDDSSTWKPCYEIVCPTPTTLVADNWLTACVTWKVGMDINNPENVADVFKKVEGVRARHSEQYFLGMLDPLLTNYHFLTTALESSMPDLVAALVASFSHAGYDHRLRDDISYTMYLDTGLLGNLVVDRVRTAFQTESSAVRAYLMAMINEAELPIDRMVQLKERQPTGTHTDQGEAYGALKANGNPYATATYPPAAGGAAVDGPDLITKFRIRLVPTSEVFAFGTGEIRTGIRQDFAMARQNKVGWFVEEAVKLGKFGVSPWFALNIDLCPTGARVGWVDPNDLSCGQVLGS